MIHAVAENSLSLADARAIYRRLSEQRTCLQQEKASIELDLKGAGLRPELYPAEKLVPIRERYHALNAELDRVIREEASLLADHPALREELEREFTVHIASEAEEAAEEPIKIEEEEEFDEHTESDIPADFPSIAWRGPYATYHEAVSPTTSAPDAFHYAAIDAAVGCRLGRRVYMYYGQTKRVYPNGNSLLIGPTGDHKGTAGEGTVHLLSPYQEDLAVLDGVGSAEGLSDWLAGSDREEIGLPPAESHLLYVDEFGALATIGGWSASTLYYHLCRLFECPERYSIKFRKAPVNLERPTLSILGCTTPA